MWRLNWQTKRADTWLCEVHTAGEASASLVEGSCRGERFGVRLGVSTVGVTIATSGAGDMEMLEERESEATASTPDAMEDDDGTEGAGTGAFSCTNGADVTATTCCGTGTASFCGGVTMMLAGTASLLPDFGTGAVAS